MFHLCALCFKDLYQDRQLIFRSRPSLNIAYKFTDTESLVSDDMLDPVYRAFQTEKPSLIIDNFKNDEQCEA